MSMKNQFLLFAAFISMLLPNQTIAQFEFVQIDSYINRMVKSDAPGVSVIVTRGDSTIFHKAVGMADLELGIPLKKEHKFRIASVTKQFTAAAIMKLYDEGLLDVESEITDFIPNFPTHNQEIIVEQLLNHTSGIPSYTNSAKWTAEFQKKDFKLNEFIMEFAPRNMEFVPGTRFKYNDMGYYLLGYIIELLSRESYQDFLQQEFFRTAGIRNIVLDNNYQIIPGRIKGYTLKNGEYANAEYISMTQAYSAGGLLSTAEDLAKWNRALVSGKLISREALEMTWTPTKLLTGKYHNYGFGWDIQDLFDREALGHSGGINGFTSRVLYFPEEELYIAVLSNCDCNNSSLIAENIAAIMLKEKIKDKAEEIAEEKKVDLKQFIGTYNLVPGFDLVITEKEGILMVQATGQDIFPMEPEADLLYRLKDSDAQIEFVPDGSGRVNELILYQSGMSLPGKRIN